MITCQTCGLTAKKGFFAVHYVAQYPNGPRDRVECVYCAYTSCTPNNKKIEGQLA